MTMRVLITLILLVATVQSFEKFSRKALRKMYRQKKVEYHMDNIYRSTQDEKEHFKEFRNYANMVKQHNEEDGMEWQSEINKFAMMTEAERELYRGLNMSRVVEKEPKELELQKRFEDHTNLELNLMERADSVDYTHKLPPIKNQGGCGSCWTFGGVAPMEYQVNKNRKTNKVLSEQQYLDCVYEKKEGVDGCHGGFEAHCWTWSRDNGNLLASAKDYPYVAKDGRCNKDVKNAISGIQVGGYHWISRSDEHLFAAVADPKIGVIAVGVGAYKPFTSYKSGVFSATGCSQANHAVNIVGYGSSQGLLYWKVRNSWGTWWGENGYIRMKRGPNVNVCGICDTAFYPVVTGSSDDDDEPRECIEKTDTDGSKYRGTKSVTKSGRTCQRWDSQSPNGHTRTPQNYPNSGLVENYCRNPDGEPGVWCYNSGGTSPRWELCDIPVCDD